MRAENVPATETPLAVGRWADHERHGRDYVSEPDWPRCSTPDCQRPRWAKGLCAVCYRMVRVYGVPKTGWHDRAQIVARRIAFLWANIDKRGPDECWPWMRKLRAGGHGQLRWMTGQIGAHVAVYEVTYGEVPEDPDRPGRKLDVDHLCHDPAVCSLKTECPHRACCNPAHLQAVPGAANRRRGDRTRPSNGTKTGGKCEPGCTCGRHRSSACAPGCTCNRHVRSPERRAGRTRSGLAPAVHEP